MSQCVGEWNEVSREEKINENGNMMFHIDPVKSDLNQLMADALVKDFKKLGVWRWHFGIGITFHILLPISISSR